MSQRTQDILDFIDWGLLLVWREEFHEDHNRWQDDMSWKEMGCDAVCLCPGDIEPLNEIDQYLPEYTGLINIQLYWPSLSP